MKFSCETEALTAAMSIAGSVIPKKSPWPILLNLKIVTNDQKITIVGSDGDTTFEADLVAEVETEGAACLPFATLSKFIGAAKGDQVSFDMEKSEALVKSGRNRITLLSSAVEDYPIYKPAEGEPVTVDGPTFCHALRFCSAAASDSEVQYHLTGAAFLEYDEGVIAWGTDGKVAHKAAISDLKTLGGGGIIPAQAAQTILSVAEKASTVKALICERGWGVETDKCRVWGKVIDAQYPDMQKMMSQFSSWDDLASLEHADISAGIEVAGCGADVDSTKSRSVIINCKKGDPLVLRGGRPAGGVRYPGRAEVDADVQSDFAGAFNSVYLRNAMTGLKVDRVSLRFTEIRDGDKIISVSPAQISNSIEMSAVIFGMRVPDAELADV